MATVVSTMFLASCADDVYDPSKEPQATPTEILWEKASMPPMVSIGP